MSLRQRLGKLERRLSVGGPCPECQRTGGYEIIRVPFDQIRSGQEPESRRPTSCPKCGQPRRLIQIVLFDRRTKSPQAPLDRN